MNQSEKTLVLAVLFLAVPGARAAVRAAKPVPPLAAARPAAAGAFVGRYAAAKPSMMGLDSAIVKKTGPKSLSISLAAEGEEGSFSADAVQTREGVWVFSGDDFGQDCDNPGCYNLTKIAGVIYRKKVGKKTVPAIKARITLEYPHPEYPGDTEGEKAYTVRYFKKP